jgi:hypothetical protein
LQCEPHCTHRSTMRYQLQSFTSVRTHMPIASTKYTVQRAHATLHVSICLHICTINVHPLHSPKDHPLVIVVKCHPRRRHHREHLLLVLVKHQHYSSSSNRRCRHSSLTTAMVSSNHRCRPLNLRYVQSSMLSKTEKVACLCCMLYAALVAH